MDCLTTQITPLLARGNKTSHFHIIIFPRHSIEMTIDGAASRTPESLTGCCCRGCRCSLLTCLDFHTTSVYDTLRSDKRTASFFPFCHSATAMQHHIVIVTSSEQLPPVLDGIVFSHLVKAFSQTCRPMWSTETFR